MHLSKWLLGDLALVVCRYLYGVDWVLSTNIIDQARKYWWTDNIEKIDNIEVKFTIGKMFYRKMPDLIVKINIGNERQTVEFEIELFMEMIVTGSSANVVSIIFSNILSRFDNPKKYNDEISQMVQSILIYLLKVEDDTE